MQHNSDPYLYADDTNIFKEIRTSDDCEDLQKDIHLMYEWSDKWMLKFHPDKCKTMRIRKSNIDLKEYSLKPGIPLNIQLQKRMLESLLTTNSLLKSTSVTK